jgi:6-phosphogluconolactonase
MLEGIIYSLIMRPDIKVFDNASEMAEELVEEFYRYTKELCELNKKVNIAISGGSSPLYFYRRLASYNSISLKKIEWSKIHIFWVDERCIPPHHQDSNYGMADRLFLRTINIPRENIHRIRGEKESSEESMRYSEELKLNIPLRNSYPSFDWIFLGLGEDGHTASIFPDQLNLLFSNNFCEPVIHPQTKQKRITLTGKVLMNSRRITFLITGESKKKVVKEIINKEPSAKLYPASYIKSLGGKLEWYLDNQTAQQIKRLP